MISQIRNDLREIRYYYRHQELFEGADKIIGENRVVKLAKKYNGIMCKALPRLYDLYYQLYIVGLTQLSYARISAYALDSIQKLHTQLLIYLEREINKEVEEECRESS